MKNITENERLTQFNDYWGKKVVKEYLIKNGVDENTIYDTKKYDCCDLIVEMGGTIHIIEIKNRYTPPKYYRELPAYGIQDVKYNKLLFKKKEIEVYHNKKCRIHYINLSEHHMYVHDITDVDRSSLEVQERYTNKQHQSDVKVLHKYYQLKVNAEYTKSHQLPDELKQERMVYYGK